MDTNPNLIGINALLEAADDTIAEPAVSIAGPTRKRQKVSPDTAVALLQQVKDNTYRLDKYNTWFEDWFKSTFKMDLPTDGPGYEASQNIRDAFIVQNYVSNHPGEITSTWESGMALNNAIKDNYAVLIQFAADKAYNASTWGAVMNQLSSFMQRGSDSAKETYTNVIDLFQKWGRGQTEAARQFFQTNLGALIKLTAQNLAIGGATVGAVYYFPTTIAEIIYNLAKLGAYLGIYGSVALGIAAVGAVLNKYITNGGKKIAGIDIVGNSEYILGAINKPNSEEAIQMRATLMEYVSPTLEKIQELKTQSAAVVRNESKSDSEQLADLITASKQRMQDAIEESSQRASKIAVSDIWWNTFRRVSLEEDGNIVSAKTAADEAVDAFKSTLNMGAGTKAAGGRGGQKTKRKRQSKKTKAKKHRNKSHKKRRAKSHKK